MKRRFHLEALHVAMRVKHIAVVDIGGGSTEVIFGIAGEAPRFVHSFNIGCRRMTERFLPSNPPTISECEALHRWVHDAMAPVFAEALSRDSSPLMRIVAVAGTATSVVSIDKHMEVYDSDQVHGTVVPRDTLQRIYERLRAMPLEERKTGSRLRACTSWGYCCWPGYFD